MKNLRSALWLAGVLAALALGGCSQSSQRGISINITDAPVDNLDQVVVTFTGVTFHNADGTDVVVPVSPPKAIELTHFSGGATEILLDEYPLAAGDYEWFRLSIDPAQTYVVEEVGGAQLPLNCPSCFQSGLKFNRPFTVEQTGIVEFTLDFDLRKSITYTNPNGYKLRPTVRVLDADTVLSEIAGTVTDNTTGQTFLAALDAGQCAVYAYQGAGVVPDDIFLDGDGVEQHPAAPVFATAPVAYDAGESAYAYVVANLPAGLTYTVALTCDADDPAAEDAVTFQGTGAVSLGVAPATYNFVLVDPAP